MMRPGVMVIHTLSTVLTQLRKSPVFLFTHHEKFGRTFANAITIFDQFDINIFEFNVKLYMNFLFHI